MTKVTVLVAEATTEQLATFAAQSLGFEIKPQTPVPTARAMVQKAWDKPDFVLDIPDRAAMVGMPPEGETVVIPKRVVGADEPKVRIVLHKSDKPGGDRPEFVAHNGVGMLVPRGEECEIPYRYFEILKNAVETVFGEDSEGNRIERRIPAFQFTPVSMPDPRAIEAYIERTSGKSLS